MAVGIEWEIDAIKKRRERVKNFRAQAINLNPELPTPRTEIFKIAELLEKDHRRQMCYVKDDQGRIWELPYYADYTGEPGEVSLEAAKMGYWVEVEIICSETDDIATKVLRYARWISP